MGIRSPGEKTAFEVSTLTTAASRIFQSKITYFELMFETKLLNDMLEVGRRNLSTPELVKTLDDDVDVVVFRSISKEDLKATGKLRPVGASHYERRAMFIQNLVQLLNSAIGQDPAINVHLSGVQLARAAEEILGLDRFDLFQENIRLFEQAESQRLTNALTEQLQMEQSIPNMGIDADADIDQEPTEETEQPQPDMGQAPTAG
jgi:hypothetical protein